MQKQAMDFESVEFCGVLLIGAAGTGKSLLMEKLLKSFQQFSESAIHSCNGVTNEMKAAIGTNLVSDIKQPLYLLLDEAAKLNDSDYIQQVLNIGRSNKIQVFLAYQSVNQIPEGIANSCYLKVVFRAADKASAEYCSLILGGIREWETVPGDKNRFQEKIYRVVVPSQLFELPQLHFYVVAQGHPCTGEIHSISEFP